MVLLRNEPNGGFYTEDTIQERLTMRNFMDGLRGQRVARRFSAKAIAGNSPISWINFWPNIGESGMSCVVGVVC